MNRRLALAVLGAAGPVLLAAVLPASPARGAGITGQWNAPMCARNGFERVKLAVTELAATDSAGACVSSERFRGAFMVTSVTRNLPYQFPAMDSGFVPEGESTCASSRDACFAYPVRQEFDGMPVASFGAWLNPGVWKLAFDTWFSPVRARHSYAQRAGDTEVMIWFSHPGQDWSGAIAAYVRIDGAQWGVASWEQPSGVRYVAYIAQAGPGARREPRDGGQRVSYAGVWLNPFWRDAEARGWLRKSEWLWAVDLGFELTYGGSGDNIHGYTLTGVRLRGAVQVLAVLRLLCRLFRRGGRAARVRDAEVARVLSRSWLETVAPEECVTEPIPHVRGTVAPGRAAGGEGA